MTWRCPASAVALLIALGTAPVANAQSLSFEKYCNEVYGAQSRAVVLDEHDADSWRCTKGREMVEIDPDDVCARQYPGRGAVAANPNDPKSWACVARDRTMSGVVSRERVAADMERDATKLRDDGKPTAFCRRFYFYLPANRTEFSTLAKNSVFLISVWMKKPEELPIKRAYVQANGQEIPVPKVSGARAEEDGKSVTAQVCGPHREDGIYLVPTAALLREGLLTIDFTGKRTGYRLLQLPSRLALDRAQKNPMFKSPDAPPNARPDLKALQSYVARKFPGFPVPTALP